MGCCGKKKRLTDLPDIVTMAYKAFRPFSFSPQPDRPGRMFGTYGERVRVKREDVQTYLSSGLFEIVD
jgi:hypothetical protein